MKTFAKDDPSLKFSTENTNGCWLIGTSLIYVSDILGRLEYILSQHWQFFRSNASIVKSLDSQLHNYTFKLAKSNDSSKDNRNPGCVTLYN